MSELKSVKQSDVMWGHWFTEYYLKSEADKVIAELEADYKEACDRLQTANLIKDEQLAATRHSKYKRCLAMAMWCDAEVYNIRRTPLCDMSEHEYRQYENDFWQRWHKRWLELAEQFKPNLTPRGNA